MRLIFVLLCYVHAEDRWISVENALPSAFEFKFPLEHTALILIDFQRGFMDHGGFGEFLGNDVSIVRGSIQPARNILDIARKYNMHIIHTMESHLADLSDLPPTKRKITSEWNIGDEGPNQIGRIMVRNEYNTDIIDELRPLPNEKLIYKPGKGSFYNTDLNEYLQNNCITHLIFTGVTTEVCVQTTMREANDRGYTSILLTDATASYMSEFRLNVFDMIRNQKGIIGQIIGWTAKTIDIIKSIDITRSANDKILDIYFDAIISKNIENIVNVFDENAQIVTYKGINTGYEHIKMFYLNGMLKCETFLTESYQRFYALNGDISVQIIWYCDKQQNNAAYYFGFKNDKIMSIKVYSGST